ncbi:MAG: TetR/AcrR family transcriptional regulator C-terminal domain-containing protein [Kutzneria sp.]|nr:TetR/AcrR family transcriptional regulator C-terminal domain-containing protein [Kutzneria sp.]
MNAPVIARTALRLLGTVGLDGLTMRVLATELGVRPAALYWHITNKQALLDAMAAIMYAEADEGLEAPRRTEDWAHWCGERARRLRHVMLSYRDGARVLAGRHVTNAERVRATELTLRTLQDAGFDLSHAVHGIAAILDYTVGATLEAQARQAEDHPYHPGKLGELINPQRFPLTTAALSQRFHTDTDTAFEHGLQVIIAGLRTRYLDH